MTDSPLSRVSELSLSIGAAGERIWNRHLAGVGFADSEILFRLFGAISAVHFPDHGGLVLRATPLLGSFGGGGSRNEVSSLVLPRPVLAPTPTDADAHQKLVTQLRLLLIDDAAEGLLSCVPPVQTPSKALLVPSGTLLPLLDGPTLPSAVTGSQALARVTIDGLPSSDGSKLRPYSVLLGLRFELGRDPDAAEEAFNELLERHPDLAQSTARTAAEETSTAAAIGVAQVYRELVIGLMRNRPHLSQIRAHRATLPLEGILDQAKIALVVSAAMRGGSTADADGVFLEVRTLKDQRQGRLRLILPTEGQPATQVWGATRTRCEEHLKEAASRLGDSLSPKGRRQALRWALRLVGREEQVDHKKATAGVREWLSGREFPAADMLSSSLTRKDMPRVGPRVVERPPHGGGGVRPGIPPRVVASRSRDAPSILLLLADRVGPPIARSAGSASSPAGRPPRGPTGPTNRGLDGGRDLGIGARGTPG